MSPPILKSLPPPVNPNCCLIAVLSQNGKPYEQEDGSHVLVDLSGGDSHIQWNPNLQIASNARVVSLLPKLDTYSLRVWKRRHGWLDVHGDNTCYTEAPYNDLWADWLEEHSECGFLIADVEFRVLSMGPHRNGVEIWMTGRKISP